VERAGCGDQLLAVLGVDDLVDQSIDDRVFDAGDIARTRRVGRLAAPVVALLVAGRFALREARGDRLEFESLVTLDVLRRVDDAQRGINAETPERLDQAARDDFRARRAAEELDLELLAGLLVDHAAVLDGPASLVEQ